MPPVRIEEDNPLVTLSGTWVRLEEADASAGAYALSSTAGDSMEITFEAEHVALYRRVGPSGGRASVRVDESDYGRLDFYFPEERWQVPAVLDHLGPGKHVLTLTVLRNANASSTGTDVTVDALDMPSPFHANESQLQAEQHVNYYRDLVGVRLARLDRAINLAAQAHADYDMQHHEGHYETFGKAGYTGDGPGQRCRYFGYNSPWYEVIHYYGDPIRSIDGWMATVYHRIPFVLYRTSDFGYGIGGEGRATSVIDTGSRGAGSPSSRVIVVYPASGQTDVPTSWNGAESPNPLPDKPKPVGYPVSLNIETGSGSTSSPLRLPGMPPWSPSMRLFGRAQQGWTLDTAELLAPGGEPLPVYVLDRETDPATMLGDDIVFVIPVAPFQAATTYTAHVSGSDSKGAAFDKTWSFTTTGSRSSVEAIAPGGVTRED